MSLEEKVLLTISGILATITAALVGLMMFSTYWAIFHDGSQSPWAWCAVMSFIFALFSGLGAFTTLITAAVE